MEKYIWSLDISTTNIGCALWNTKGKLIELKHLELKTDKNVPVADRDIYKAEIFRNYIEEYNSRIKNDLKGEIEFVVVEEPLFGSNNANTVSLLYGFNGICRYTLFKEFNKFPIKISVHESRKLFLPEFVERKKVKGEMKDVLSFPAEWRSDKKHYIWEKVALLEPQIEWFYNRKGKLKDSCYDMSDSFAVGIAGLIKLDIISKEDWKEKSLLLEVNKTI